MNTIYKQYEARLKPGDKTGQEVEAPLVMKNSGRQPSLENISSMLDAILRIEKGWKPVSEILLVDGRKSRDYLTSVVNTESGFREEVTTDMPIGIMELGLKPEASLPANEERLRRRFAMVLEAADMAGIAVLGLGIQPFQKRSFENMMPKQRYSYLVGYFGDDLINMTVTAASQIHLDVSRENAIGTLNTMIGFSPAIIALTANSTILEGNIDRHQEFRGTAWDAMANNNIIEGDRVGVPERFATLQKWYSRISSFKPIFAKRQDNYMYFDSEYRSFSQLCEAGHANTIDIATGLPSAIKPGIEDFVTMLGTVWTDARLTGYGTVELRAPAFQPSLKWLMAINALALGLRNSNGEAGKYLEKYSDSEIKMARSDAITNGLDASMGSVPIKEVSYDMLKIAARGLEKSDARYLRPMHHALEEGMNHAVKTRMRFSELKARSLPEEDFVQAFVHEHIFRTA